MAQPEKLLQLILNSLTLKTKLTAEGLEHFVARAFALPPDKQDQLAALFEKEAEDMKKVAENQQNIVKEFYQKLKETKWQSMSSLRKIAENTSKETENQKAESLLAGL